MHESVDAARMCSLTMSCRSVRPSVRLPACLPLSQNKLENEREVQGELVAQREEMEAARMEMEAQHERTLELLDLERQVPDAAC